MNTPAANAPDDSLYESIRGILSAARANTYKAINFSMVQSYWHIGRLITEDELQRKRAEYGKAVLKTLATRLTAEFGKGFDESNLRYMCLFYKAFPIYDALRPELSWTHYRLLLRVEKAEARVHP